MVYPPLPAILAIPFTLVLPTDLSQVLVSRIAAGVSAGILFLALRAFGAPRLVAITARAALDVRDDAVLFERRRARVVRGSRGRHAVPLGCSSLRRAR